MLTCMVSEIIDIEAAREAKIPYEFRVLIVKFPCSVALHMSLTPEIDQGLQIMKYANNQADLFTENGDHLSFLLGFL